MSLLEERCYYRPFEYPWAYEAWLMQQRLHWLPEEVPMSDDIKDWNMSLTEGEKNLLTQIFRFFTQADLDVNNCYMREYSKIFKVPEVCMMLSAFSNMETIHMAGYAYLIDSVGMPESEYLTFVKYKEMRDKHEYMRKFSCDDPESTAKTMAVFGAFTEGVQLFASFAVLLNFPRHGKMKGMGQIITWSARDETLHSASIIKLFHCFMDENNSLWNEKFKNELIDISHAIIEHEDAFIDLAFSSGDIKGLTASEVKQYIRYVANIRLRQLGLPTQFKIENNPLPWMEEMLNGAEFANFFENRVTEYSRSSTEGSWDDVF